MYRQLLLARLVTSSLVLSGVRFPSDTDAQAHMLRDGGDLWSPSEPGSNVIPCGDWSPMATRMDVIQGEPFVLGGSVPITAGGGVLAVDGIYHENPDFNLAGVLYKSHRFAVQDIGGHPANFSLELAVPEDAKPGPISLQVKFVGLNARHPYFQCVDLNAVPPSHGFTLSALEWWLIGIGIATFVLLVCCLVFCCTRKRSSKKSADNVVPILPRQGSRATSTNGTGATPSPVRDLAPSFKDVSVKDPRDADSDKEEGPSYMRSDLEIENLAKEFEDEQEDRHEGDAAKHELKAI